MSPVISHKWCHSSGPVTRERSIVTTTGVFSSHTLYDRGLTLLEATLLMRLFVHQCCFMIIEGQKPTIDILATIFCHIHFNGMKRRPWSPLVSRYCIVPQFGCFGWIKPSCSPCSSSSTPPRPRK